MARYTEAIERLTDRSPYDVSCIYRELHPHGQQNKDSNVKIQLGKKIHTPAHTWQEYSQHTSYHQPSIESIHRLLRHFHRFLFIAVRGRHGDWTPGRIQVTDGVTDVWIGRMSDRVPEGDPDGHTDRVLKRSYWRSLTALRGLKKYSTDNLHSQGVELRLWETRSRRAEVNGEQWTNKSKVKQRLRLKWSWNWT